MTVSGTSRQSLDHPSQAYRPVPEGQGFQFALGASNTRWQANLAEDMPRRFHPTRTRPPTHRECSSALARALGASLNSISVLSRERIKARPPPVLVRGGYGPATPRAASGLYLRLRVMLPRTMQGRRLVEKKGLEPSTSSLRTTRSPS